MRQDSGIGVLDKAVGVLHAVADSPCGLAELCERTGLPRATAHRLAAGLEVHRLLTRDDDGRWRLGPALTELAGQINDPLLAAGAAVLPRLREITGESVQIYRREGTARICIAALEPPAGLRDTVPVGARLPMTAGSGAKVLLAYADAATQQAVLPTAKFTDRTLAEVRKRGWAQSAAEREPGVASVSAPVRDGSRRRDRRCVGVRPDRSNGPASWRAMGRGSFGGGRCAHAPAVERSSPCAQDSRSPRHESKLVCSQSPACTPDGIRTHATAVRGRRPRPLDDGGQNISGESA